MGVALTHSTSAEKYRCRTYTPPRRHASFHRRKGRWGWVDVDVGSSEKISLQDLYPLSTPHLREPLLLCTSARCGSWRRLGPSVEPRNRLSFERPMMHH